jgi:acyl-CoA reductase-like NAD-dependent aldehyde dehydrogenase
MGPLFGGPKAVESLMAMVTDAVAAGATVLSGGKVVEKDGYSFILPTLVTGANPQMKIMREEAFGPILPVMVVASDDEALTHINHPLFGLTTSVFTHNAALQDRVIAAASSGTVFINWCNDVHAEVAWSGSGQVAEGFRNALAAVLLVVIPFLPVPLDLLKKQGMEHNGRRTRIRQAGDVVGVGAEWCSGSHHQGRSQR